MAKLVFACLVVLVPWLAACGKTEAADRPAPGVLLVVVDGLRADHVQCNGYDRPTTPTLDRLAEKGLRFRQTFTNSPSLLPSHVTLITGCEPFVARRYLKDELDKSVELRWKVPDKVPRIAVEFLAHGYETAAFVDHPYLAPVFGFAPGFEQYVESSGRERGAPYLTMRLTQWLREVDRDAPWFAYLHLHDLERSWSRPQRRWERFFTPRPGLEDVPPVGADEEVFFAVPYPRWRGGSRSLGEYEAQYDGHLRGLDEAIDRLLGSLQISGRADETTIAVVGSHGIQFGEAGTYITGGRYSMADLHVPWILRPRAGLLPVDRQGTTVDHLASLSDVGPTLLELSALGVPRGTHGISQAPHVLGPPPDAPLRAHAFASCGVQEGGVVIGDRMCLELLYPGETESDRYRRSWIGMPVDPFTDTEVRFYDRFADPFPPLEAGRAGGEPGEFEAFMTLGLEWLDRMDLVRQVLQETTVWTDPVDPATVKRLQEEGLLVEDL